MLLISITNIRKDKKLHNVVVVPEKIKLMYPKSNIFIPLKLPMIVKPKEYNINVSANGKVHESLGGYLSNDITSTDRLIIPKARYETNSKYYTDICHAVNNMSCMAYRINTEVLNFIISKGLKYDLLVDKNSVDSIRKEHYNPLKNK